jgi:16S rRNA (uracil1498-N3)-methyltransferase
MTVHGVIPPDHPRLFCPDLPATAVGQPMCALDSEQTRHIRKALRFKPGAELELIDGQGGLARATLESYGRDEANCRIEQLTRHDKPAPRLTVATAMPKGGRGESMVDQLSQLGVDTLVPLTTQRSVVHPRDQKRQRFERLAKESAKQSGRLFLMRLAEQTSLDALLKAPAGEGELTLALTARGSPARPEAEQWRRLNHLRLIIGPEGGFTDEELTAMQQAGARPWTINHNVLRIETAAPAGAAVVNYLLAAENALE